MAQMIPWQRLSEARKASARFELNARVKAPRKNSPEFFELARRYAQGEKFESTAHDLGLTKDSVRKYARTYLRSWLEPYRRRALKRVAKKQKLSVLRRLEKTLPMDSAVRVVLQLARSAGCNANVLYHQYDTIVTNAVEIEGRRVLIYEARRCESSRKPAQRQPNVRFLISRRSLKKHAWVIFLLRVEGYPLRTFGFRTEEVLDRVFGASCRTRKKMSVSVAKPKQRPRGFDLWRSGFGSALEAFGPMKKRN